MTLTSPIEIPLSEQQQAAVLDDHPAILVVAGAGSGKTEVVARRAQRLLQGADRSSGRVLALSYTVKAADELRSRLRERIGNLSEYVDTETIHGFAHTLVRQHGTKIGLPLEPELFTRDEERVELMNNWRLNQGEPPLEDPMATLRQIDLDRATNTVTDDAVDWAEALASVRALDYPALLTAARTLLDTRSTQRQLTRLYSHVIVDEAQNLTAAQYDLLTALIGAPGSTTRIRALLVGDDKQSIISFAGADPGLLQKFSRDYDAVTYRLTANFRSAQALSQLAHRIAIDLGHQGDSISDHAAPGLISRWDAADETAEASYVCNWIEELLAHGLPREALARNEPPTLRAPDIAVLGRTATALRAIGEGLEARGTPFSAASGSNDWLETQYAKIALEIISLKNSTDHQSTRWQLSRLLETSPEAVASLSDLARVLEASSDPVLKHLATLTQAATIADFMVRLQAVELPEGTGDNALAAWTADLAQLAESWYDYDHSTDRASITWGNFRLFCSRRQRGDSSDGVQLLTVHRAQGQEFKAVAVVGLNAGQFPDFRATTSAAVEAELRTFYVAVSRARRLLLLTRPARRSTRYGSRETSPSPFLRYLTTN